MLINETVALVEGRVSVGHLLAQVNAATLGTRCFHPPSALLPVSDNARASVCVRIDKITLFTFASVSAGVFLVSAGRLAEI